MLTELEYKIYNFIKEKKQINSLTPITNAFIAKGLGLSKNYTIKGVNGLIEKGQLQRIKLKYYDILD